MLHDESSQAESQETKAWYEQTRIITSMALIMSIYYQRAGDIARGDAPFTGFPHARKAIDSLSNTPSNTRIALDEARLAVEADRGWKSLMLEIEKLNAFHNPPPVSVS